MDPASAFSLAGTVVQFIDSGAKLASLVWSLYHQESDRGDYYDHLDKLVKLTQCLDNVCIALGPSPSGPATANGSEHGLHQLASECKKTATQLLLLLKRLGFPDQPPSRKRRALKRAFQMTWNESEIEKLKSKLDDFRVQLNMCLLVSLRDFAMQTLSKQEETLRALEIPAQRKPETDGIASPILEYLASNALFSEKAALRMNMRDALLAELSLGRGRMTAATAHRISLNPDDREALQAHMLGWLWYPEMQDRESRIPEKYKATFEWVFRDHTVENHSWCSIKEWLEGDGQIYWITGKAGSGKSTLMKYLCQSDLRDDNGQTAPRCLPYLTRWAGNKEVIIASFYFWNSNTQIQMSHAGLLRALLYQLLKRDPELIPITLPSRWEAMSMFGGIDPSWEEQELQSALEAVIKNVTADRLLCCFIDGLDEFQGNPDIMVNFIKELSAQNPRVKFCVASRPWVVFQDAFNTKPHLMLENLTYNDIRLYVSDKFHTEPEYQKLLEREPGFAGQLIDNIVSKASGVFLWITLVVSSLLSGLSYGDRIADLQRRLDLLPPDLENLYDKILHSLDPFYLEHAAQLLKILEASSVPVPLIVLCLADEETVSSVIEMPLKALSPLVLSRRLDAATRRLNSRWKGLLEVDRGLTFSDPDKRGQKTVQYLHRTVRDFIKREKVQEYLESSITSSFDPHLNLCLAYCAHTKTYPDIREPELHSIHACLRHASQVLPRSEKDMLQLLDHMANDLPVMFQEFRASHEASTTVRQEIQTREARGAFLGLAWGDGILAGKAFGKTFLSLAVQHGVTVYVQERAGAGCLVSYDWSEHQWPLLRDAIKIPVDSSMVRLLLRLGGKPQDSWESLLRLLADPHRSISSLADLDEEARSTVEAMVAYGADVKYAEQLNIKQARHRIHYSQPPPRNFLPLPDDAFQKSFFRELRSIPKISGKHPWKWRELIRQPKLG